MSVSDTPPTAREIRFGCAAVLGLGVIGFFVLSLATCALLDRDVASGRLPSNVQVSRILAVSQTGGFREACVYAAYELEPASAAQIEREGLAFFRGARPAKDDEMNQFGLWGRTPVLMGDRRKVRVDYGDPITLFALSASSGCGSRRNKPVNAQRLLKAPGSFYSISQNGEGLVVINPASATAVFLYFG